MLMKIMRSKLIFEGLAILCCQFLSHLSFKMTVIIFFHKIVPLVFVIIDEQVYIALHKILKQTFISQHSEHLKAFLSVSLFFTHFLSFFLFLFLSFLFLFYSLLFSLFCFSLSFPFCVSISLFLSLVINCFKTQILKFCFKCYHNVHLHIQKIQF